jgi:hypothetical protein
MYVKLHSARQELGQGELLISGLEVRVLHGSLETSEKHRIIADENATEGH